MNRYCFDIDGTICTNTNGAYEKATPFLDRIAFIKGLMNNGAIVYFQTARGSETGINWSKFTYDQLVSWGIDEPIIFFNKPTADIYIDDKGINSESFDWSL